MALQLFSQTFFSVYKAKQKHPQIILKPNSRSYPSIKCADKNNCSYENIPLPVYQPTIWTHNFIEALDVNFPMNSREEVIKELEKKGMELNFDYETGGLSILQLLEQIDDIERLGLDYRFQNDIRRALNIIASIKENNTEHEEKEGSLHEASLRFRLLRKHGYNVSQDFLLRFKDGHGGFMRSLETDVRGLLSLYEASYLSFEWERDLHEAKLFATKHLMKLKCQENEAREDINHALELPSYRRMLRLQARWYIGAYSKRKDANMHVLELATFDYNMVQLEFKKELQEVSRWWKNIGLASKLSFVRDRLVECFFWSVGVVFEPQYNSCRVELTKVCTLITVIDDIYDVYGSLDELVMFTDAVKRWDINAVKHMPEYLQLCFRTLYNTINEIGSYTSIAQGQDIIPALVKVWGDLLESFLLEAKWTDNKYIPTLQEYMDNAWRSVSGVVILTHGYFLINQEFKEDVVENMEKYNDLLKWSSIVFRLCNDLGTSSDEIARGKTANAISCYMQESGACEKVARKYIKTLIDQAWREMIKARVACSQELTDPFIDMAINLARISHCVYQYGDGHGAPDARAKERVLSVILDPIPIKDN
ncbi:(E)-beta-ocimene synthase, chloroplastic [Lactuca sativa]|uniref:Uncharacterized protein n=1 Tax=Lactuca sativa TaxID=4236 RepID=A0A9R1VW40_LACSA|nr:(E)-beta-ocimene synthase, chloroplastic [Lactuca sativa]KAJ0213650.1 hypothetical protein LSAT_V11C400213100 [Lactuca sativa]